MFVSKLVSWFILLYTEYSNIQVLNTKIIEKGIAETSIHMLLLIYESSSNCASKL